MSKKINKLAFVFEICGVDEIMREGKGTGDFIEKFVVIEKDILSAFDVVRARFERQKHSGSGIGKIEITVLEDVEIKSR